MSRSDTRSKIPSNINQHQFIDFFKLKMGKLKFNNHGIAIIYKHEFLKDIVSNTMKTMIVLKNNLLYLNYHLYCLNQSILLIIIKIKILHFTILHLFINHLI